MMRLSLILIGLLIFGGASFLVAVRLSRWPRVQTGLIRLGDAAVTFALGLLAFVAVVMLLRAVGWLPSPR